MRDEIAGTDRIIEPYVRGTPTISLEPGLTLQLEYHQHGGSFKPRGAFANLLLQKVGDAGVAAPPGGNHGAAVAYAANTLGIPAHIFIPSVAPQVEVDRIRSQEARLETVGDRRAATALL